MAGSKIHLLLSLILPLMRTTHCGDPWRGNDEIKQEVIKTMLHTFHKQYFLNNHKFIHRTVSTFKIVQILFILWSKN